MTLHAGLPAYWDTIDPVPIRCHRIIYAIQHQPSHHNRWTLCAQPDLVLVNHLADRVNMMQRRCR